LLSLVCPLFFAYGLSSRQAIGAGRKPVGSKSGAPWSGEHYYPFRSDET
jgi:hypothetical protein